MIKVQTALYRVCYLIRFLLFSSASCSCLESQRGGVGLSFLNLDDLGLLRLRHFYLWNLFIFTLGPRPKFGVIYVDLVFAVKVSIDILSTFLNHSKHIHVCRLSLLHFMNLLCLGLYECTEVIWIYSPAEICSVPDGTSHWVQFGTAMRSPIKNTKTERSKMFVWLQVSKCIDSIECT